MVHCHRLSDRDVPPLTAAAAADGAWGPSTCGKRIYVLRDSGTKVTDADDTNLEVLSN